MCNSMHEALTFDQDAKPLSAIRSYEIAISEGCACLEGYLNLAVLYVECSDKGFVHHHRIPEEVENNSVDKSIKTLARIIHE